MKSSIGFLEYFVGLSLNIIGHARLWVTHSGNSFREQEMSRRDDLSKRKGVQPHALSIGYFDLLQELVATSVRFRVVKTAQIFILVDESHSPSANDVNPHVFSF